MRARLKGYVDKKNYITPARLVGDLIAFGEDVYKEYKGKGYMFLKFSTNEGTGFIAFKIDKDVNIDKIFVKGATSDSEQNIIESLIYAVRNIGASLQKDIVIEKMSQHVEKFLKKRNESMESQGLERRYNWVFEKEVE